MNRSLVIPVSGFVCRQFALYARDDCRGILMIHLPQHIIDACGGGTPPEAYTEPQTPYQAKRQEQQRKRKLAKLRRNRRG